MKTSAKIIADTINPFRSDSRITTFEYVAPRYLLAEINTHRVIARSAASSRAIPIQKRIDMVRSAPFVPKVFGKNRPGMQSTEELDEEKTAHARDIWIGAAQAAADQAHELNVLGVHKQQANRILEPFVYVTGVMTGTEWENFFTLRWHKDADPEFYDLADAMAEAYGDSKPRTDYEHLLYADTIELKDTDLELRKMVSAARCARISYRTFEGILSTIDDDVSLCHKLIESGHFSRSIIRRPPTSSW